MFVNPGKSYKPKIYVGNKNQTNANHILTVSKGQKFILQDQVTKQLEEISLNRDYHLNYHLINGKVPPWVRLLTRAMANSTMGIQTAVQNRQDLQKALLGLIKTSQDMITQSQELDYGKVLQATFVEMAKSEGGKGPFTELLKNYHPISVTRARLNGSSDPVYLTGNFFNGVGVDFKNYGTFDSSTVHFGSLEVSSVGERYLSLYPAHWAQGSADTDGDTMMLIEFIKKFTRGPEPSHPSHHYVIPIKNPGTKRMGGLSILPGPTDVLGSLKYINNQISHGLPQFHSTGLGQPQTIQDFLEGDEFTKSSFDRAVFDRNAKDRLGKHILQNGFDPASRAEFDEIATKFGKYVNGTKDVGSTTIKVISQEIEEALQSGLSGNPEDYQAFLMETAGIGDKRIQILEGLLKATSKNNDISSFDRSLHDTFKVFFGKIRGMNRGGLAPLEFLSLMSTALGEIGVDAFGSYSPEDLKTLANLTANPFGYAVQEAAGKGMKKRFNFSPKDQVTGVNPVNRLPRSQAKQSIFESAMEAGFLELKPIQLSESQIPKHLRDLDNPISLLLNPTLQKEGLRKTSLGGTPTDKGGLEGFLIGNSIIVRKTTDELNYETELLDPTTTIQRYIDNVFNPEFEVTKGAGKGMGTSRMFELVGAFSPESLTKVEWARVIAQKMVEADLDQFYIGKLTRTQGDRITAMITYITSAGKKMINNPELVPTFKGLITHAQMVATVESTSKFKEFNSILQYAEINLGRQSALKLNQDRLTIANPNIVAQEIASLNVIVPEESNNGRRLQEALAYLHTVGVQVGDERLKIIGAAKESNYSQSVVSTMLDLRGGFVEDKRLIKNISQLRNAHTIYGTTFAYADIDVLEATMKAKGISRAEALNILKTRDELLGKTDPTLKSTYQGVSEAWTTRAYSLRVMHELQDSVLGLDRKITSDTPPADMTGWRTQTTLTPSGRKTTKWVKSFEPQRMGKLIGDAFEKIEVFRELDSAVLENGQNIDLIMTMGEMSSKGMLGLDPVVNLYQANVQKGNPQAIIDRTRQYYQELEDLNAGAQNMSISEYSAKRSQIAERLAGEVGFRRQKGTIKHGDQDISGYFWVKQDNAHFSQSSSEMSIFDPNEQVTTSVANIFSPLHEDEMVLGVKNLIELNGGTLSPDQLKLFRQEFTAAKAAQSKKSLPSEHLALISELHSKILKNSDGQAIQVAGQMKQSGMLAGSIITPDEMLKTSLASHLKGVKINPVTVGATVGVSVGAALIASKRNKKKRESSNW